MSLGELALHDDLWIDPSDRSSAGAINYLYAETHRRNIDYCRDCEEVA